MKKEDPNDRLLARLADLADFPDADGAAPDLRNTLAKGNHRVAAKAARIIAEKGWAELAPDLAKAFGRFMRNPVKTDPGCLAKLALVDAIHELDCGLEEIFLQGLHHVQHEPVWGGTVDTAADLRGACAMALAQRAHPDIMPALVSLLVDTEVAARRAAVRALALAGNEAAEMLLRLKALTGDAEPDVVGLCFSGLMQVDPDRSLPFVARFLNDSDDTRAESAALALGESRNEAALDCLFAHWDSHVDAATRRMLALPIALSRREKAVAFLLDLVRTGSDPHAEAAVNALGIFRDDPHRRDSVRQAVDDRRDRALAKVFNRVFASDRDAAVGEAE